MPIESNSLVQEQIRAIVFRCNQCIQVLGPACAFAEPLFRDNGLAAVAATPAHCSCHLGRRAKAMFDWQASFLIVLRTRFDRPISAAASAPGFVPEQLMAQWSRLLRTEGIPERSFPSQALLRSKVYGPVIVLREHIPGLPSGRRMISVAYSGPRRGRWRNAVSLCVPTVS